MSNPVTTQLLRVSAGELAEILAAGDQPATNVLSGLAGCSLTMLADERRNRELLPEEQQFLGWGGTGHFRRGKLVTPAGAVIAQVTSLVLPSRLPAEARKLLGIPLRGEPMPAPTGVPLGPCLALFGVVREPLAALAEAGTVRSKARLMLRGVPVGLATEVISCR